MRDNYGMSSESPHVPGGRPRTYTIHRPTEPPPWLPTDDGYNWAAELKVGWLAWLEPVGSATRRGRSADTKGAVGGLLSCETDFFRWLEARNEMFGAELADADLAHPDPILQRGTGFGSRARKEATRLLWLQHKNRRQRFDKRLRAWVNRFGSLGIEDERGHENVDDMMRCALAMRAWVAVEGAGATPWGVDQDTWTFPPRVDPSEVINRRANLCTRNSKTGPWEAPTLWSAICFDLRRHDELGWRFGLCAAEDCYNVFLHTTAPKTYCSPRCGKRVRDHAKRLPQSE
jgi:hypothetical protein